MESTLHDFIFTVITERCDVVNCESLIVRRCVVVNCESLMEMSGVQRSGYVNLSVLSVVTHNIA